MSRSPSPVPSAAAEKKLKSGRTKPSIYWDVAPVGFENVTPTKKQKTEPTSTGVMVSNCSDARMKWLFQPDIWTPNLSTDTKSWEETEGYGGSFSTNDQGHLTVFPPAKKDFWRRTFYSPTLIKGDAPAYTIDVPSSEECTVDLTCSYEPKEQFDQVGMMVYLDETHWMKCGLEYCDGEVRMSVVVCNVFSDWSVVPWTSNSVRLRVHKINQGSSVVVEAASENNPLHFVRIAHLSAYTSNSGIAEAKSTDVTPPWRIGPFAACPVAQRGCSATFTNFTVGPLKPTSHDPSLSADCGKE